MSKCYICKKNLGFLGFDGGYGYLLDTKTRRLGHYCRKHWFMRRINELEEEIKFLKRMEGKEEMG